MTIHNRQPSPQTRREVDVDEVGLGPLLRQLPVALELEGAGDAEGGHQPHPGLGRGAAHDREQVKALESDSS